MGNYQISTFAAIVYTDSSRQQRKSMQSKFLLYTRSTSDNGWLLANLRDHFITLHLPNVKLVLLMLKSGPISAIFRAPPQDAWLRVHPWACDAFSCTTLDAPVGESERRSGIVSPFRMH